MKLNYYPRVLPYTVLNFYPQFLGFNMNRFLNGPGVAGHFFSTLTDNVFMNLVFGVQHSEEVKSFDWLADERKKGYKMEYSIYNKEVVKVRKSIFMKLWQLKKKMKHIELK